VRSDRDEAAIREYCTKHGFEVVSVVPFDESITEADHQGRSLIDFAPGSRAVISIEALADAVMDRTGMVRPLRA
jgi:nitrogenase subunit NifH